MSDFSAVAPPQQNFNQTSAFAAALQRAKQIAAKIQPVGTTTGTAKRPLDDCPEPDAKKGPGLVSPGQQVRPQPQAGMGGIAMGNGPPVNEDIKVPDNMVGLRVTNVSQVGGRNAVEIMIPGPKVGLIIGKGGETIKQLQEKSGAKMVVIQDGPNQEHEKPLVISGEAQKVEYAKQLVYDLIAEKDMKNFNRQGPGGGPGGNRGGGGGGGGRPDQFNNNFGNDNGAETEVLVPKAAVGVVIGKGGDMIKKIQAETGARVQFHQAREEGPGDRRCFLSGTDKQIEMARQHIEELIDSVQQRDGGGGSGGGGGGGMGRHMGGGRGGGRGGRGGGGDRFGGRGGDRNGGEYGGGGGQWHDRGNNGQQQGQSEVTFTVPSNKCGVIIGRGGETIKQINSQSGAYCELDRRSNANQLEKTFSIKGDLDQIETAKRIISDKIQIPLNFVSGNGQQSSSSMPTAYPGMAPQGYNPQGWGMPAFQQQWGGQQQGGAGEQQPPNPAGGPNPNVQVNASTGQPDYSLQWAEYYRSLGMHREAEVIEQQAKAKAAAGSQVTAPQQPPAAPQAAAAPAPAAAGGSSQPDYSAQWAEYYRSIGKLKEAEAIESQMKNKTAGAVPSVPGSAPVTPGVPAQPAAANYQQQQYGQYQQPAGGYYGGQAQGNVGGGVPQQNYNFPGYGYGGQPTGNSSAPNDN